MAGWTTALLIPSPFIQNKPILHKSSGDQLFIALLFYWFYQAAST
ncbi:hypothetical protein HMPREF9176_0771 [Streptococcus downei F0415]|nr:hypothetical protein HMPREF9176_0771 [Streptococcus downei F0415]